MKKYDHRRVLREVLDMPEMDAILREEVAVTRGELPDPYTLDDFLRFADKKGWPIKTHVREHAVREGILEKPEPLEPLPWEMPCTPAARAAAARQARSEKSKQLRAEIVKCWETYKDKPSPIFKVARAVRKSEKTVRNHLKDAGLLK